MFNQIIEVVRAWPTISQLFFAVIVATGGTIVATVFIGCLSDFLTNGVPKILHGHPPHSEPGSDPDPKSDE